MILYHAVAGQIDSKTALGVPKGTTLTTLQGGTIKVYPLPRLGTAILADQDRNDAATRSSCAASWTFDASNSIAHGISFVLRPADL